MESSSVRWEQVLVPLNRTLRLQRLLSLQLATRQTRPMHLARGAQNFLNETIAWRSLVFLRTIRKIFQRHAMYDLIFPLVVGLGIEFGTHRLAETHEGIFWTSLSLVAPILGIVLTYLAVMF